MKNNFRALMWANIDAISGKHKSASKNRDIVAKQMTPAQIGKAKDLARESIRKKCKRC